MTVNRSQLTSMSTRQKVIAAIFVVILIFLIYQIYAMLRGPSQPKTLSKTTGTSASLNPQQPVIPQAASLPKPTVTANNPQEAAIIQMQQETEAKYLTALNELQMLRLVREIAETNKAIMSAKLETLTAEKSIVDLLKPPPPPTTNNYARTLATSGSATTPTVIAPPPVLTQSTDLPYTVISVSQLQYRWNAVLGLQGNLYNVHIGDVLPADQSKVIAIDKNGVILEKNNIHRRISLVPLI